MAIKQNNQLQDSTNVSFNPITGSATVTAVPDIAVQGAINTLATKIKTLETAPSGGISNVSTTDSASIDFSGNGTPGTALTGVIKVSTTAGNSLSSDSTGLYVPTSTVQTATTTSSTAITAAPNKLAIDGANVQDNIESISKLLAYSITYSGHSKQSSFSVNFADPVSVSNNMSGINNTGSYKGYKKNFDCNFSNGIPFNAPTGYVWMANVGLHILMGGGNLSTETLRFALRSRNAQVLNDDDFEQSLFIPANTQIEGDLNTNGKLIVGTAAGNLNLGFELFVHVQSSGPNISAIVDFGDPALDFTLYLTKII